MVIDPDVLEQIVQRAQSPRAEVRNEALKQMLELPDEAMLQLLSNHFRPGRTARLRLMGRIINVLPYAIFALAFALAFSKTPLKWMSVFLVIVFLGLLLVLMAGIFIAFLSNYHVTLKTPRTPRRVFGSIASVLLGRTDPLFLPYL